MGHRLKGPGPRLQVGAKGWKPDGWKPGAAGSWKLLLEAAGQRLETAGWRLQAGGWLEAFEGWRLSPGGHPTNPE